MPPAARDGYTFPRAPSLTHHRQARPAAGHPAGLHRVRAGVGRAAPTETVSHAAVTRETADGGARHVEGQTMSRQWRVLAVLAMALAVMQPELLAQGTSPWVDAVANLSAAFTGPIARGLALVSIVIGGLMFAFGEGGSKSTLAGIIFGLGMALGAANFITWMF